MDNPLHRTVAIITGGAQGLGEALCRSLGEAGACIVIADIHGDRAAAMAEKLRHEGIASRHVRCDVADRRQADAVLAGPISGIDPGVLQDPRNVADTIRCLLQLPAETVAPEVMVIPMRETSWP